MEDKEQRREELSDFLRTRRARLSPHDAGLPEGARRRTPGLRREEVALLADVGITWYTWLEQGRPIKMSAETLGRVASALQLGPDETRYLFVLADRVPPSMHLNGDREVPEDLLRLLDGLDRGTTPAFVRNERWDVLSWNRTMGAVLTDFERVSEDDRNALYMLFARLGHYGWLVDWERSAQHLLARFRVIYGWHRDDARFTELIERCRRVSSEFREWWALHDLTEEWSGPMEFDHPVVGRLSFTYASFHPAGPPEDLEFVTYTPVPDTGTVEKIGRLMGSIRSTQLWDGQERRRQERRRQERRRQA
jgi:transcriptional regulator with XRE-family HTH domain